MTQAWLERPEGGSPIGLRLLRTFALLCGRRIARLVLYPITLYYLIRRAPERRASIAYLSRVFGRKPSLWQVAKHIFWFASVILDRVFLLSERFKRFDIKLIGLQELRQRVSLERGVLVLGSHLGSFDALRVLTQMRNDVQFRAVIDLEQSPALGAVLNALNPKLAASVINARRDGTTTALAIKEALDAKSVVTMLADRARHGNVTVTVDFLGAPAQFPASPFLLAAALKVPVVLCFGLYFGGNRYELHFESFADVLTIDRANREAALKAIVQRFADRVAHYAHIAPYNWFNFYDFWQTSTHDTAGEPRTAHSDALRQS
jgi:predicted LPLAT superfamily acyltransferase